MTDHGAADMLINLLASTNEPVQRQAAKALANLGVNGAFPASPCLRPRPAVLERNSNRAPLRGPRSREQAPDRRGRRLGAAGRPCVQPLPRRAHRGDRRARQPRCRRWGARWGGKRAVIGRVAALTACFSRPDDNESEIGRLGGIEAVVAVAADTDENVQSQAARALRNLSVCGACGCRKVDLGVPAHGAWNARIPPLAPPRTAANKDLIRRAGGVEPLRALLHREGRVAQQARRALHNLGEG